MGAAVSRLVDEFAESCRRRGITLPAEPEAFFGGFADLCWQPFDYDLDEDEDPAVELRTGTRWVVMHRIAGEIRYYAADLPELAKRFADAELGIFPSVDDAVEFSAAFLGGMELEDISAARLPPPWSRRATKAEVPWPPIDPARWQSVGYTAGRLATSDDVDARRAVFVQHYAVPGESGGLPRTPRYGVVSITIGTPGNRAEHVDMPLPRCVIVDEGNGERFPAVAIQAERTPRETKIGIRYIRGGTATRKLERLELLDGPTDEFFAEYAQELERAARKTVRDAVYERLLAEDEAGPSAADG